MNTLMNNTKRILTGSVGINTILLAKLIDFKKRHDTELVKCRGAF